MDNFNIDMETMFKEIKDMAMIIILEAVSPDKETAIKMKNILLIFKKYNISPEIAIKIMSEIVKEFPNDEKENKDGTC